MAKKVGLRKSASGKGKKAAKPAVKRAKSAPKKAVKKAAKKAAGKAVAKTAKSASSAKPARPLRKSTAKAAANLGKLHAKSKKAGKVRSPLTKGELKEFRQLLLAKRRELVGDMTGLEAEALGADRQESKGDISDHPADAGTDNFEQEFSLGLLESERNMLAEIDQSLSRIEQGIYGVCLGTGKQIHKARLAARPWAPYSIEYARMVEKGLVRAGERIVPDDEEDDADDQDYEADDDD